MTDKELKRLSRQELLEELYNYAKSNGELRLKLENKEEEMKQHFQKFEEELAAEHQKVLVISEKIKELEKKNYELSAKLRNRSVNLQDAGNIAEATIKMTDIFQEAQRTADLYVANVKKMTEQQELKLMEMEVKSRRDIQKMGDEASSTCIAMQQQVEKECCELKEKTEAECKAMKREAYFQAEEYWNNLSSRLENFYNAHQGMRELFGTEGIRIPSFREVNKQ